MQDALRAHTAYIHEHGEDLPAIRELANRGRTFRQRRRARPEPARPEQAAPLVDEPHDRARQVARWVRRPGILTRPDWPRGFARLGLHGGDGDGIDYVFRFAAS